jgi:hypothetical protein
MSKLEFLRTTKLASLLLAVQFLPPLILFVGLDSSLKVGTAAAASLILAAFLTTHITVGWRDTRHRRHIEWGPLVFATTIVLGAVIHAAIADYFLLINMTRLLETLALLFFFIASGIAFGRILVSGTDKQLNFAIDVSSVVLGLCILLRLSGLGPTGNHHISRWLSLQYCYIGASTPRASASRPGCFLDSVWP